MSVDAIPTRKLHNLPRRLNAFVGRETELAAIAANLNDPGCRLLTLLGTGGSVRHAGRLKPPPGVSNTIPTVSGWSCSMHSTSLR